MRWKNAICRGAGGLATLVALASVLSISLTGCESTDRTDSVQTETTVPESQQAENRRTERPRGPGPRPEYRAVPAGRGGGR